jgi:outer membrane protein assembly factor BamE (lipoprotein component of BamABCDE complex)
MRILIVIAFFMVISGCIAMGDKSALDESKKSQIKVGMTKQEVVSIMGEPSHKRTKTVAG